MPWIASQTFLGALRAMAIVTASFLASNASGQSWPQDKPIRIVVPYPPGGSTDTVTRLIATHLGPRINRAVVVENIPGGSGNIGTNRVVRSPPDGHTLVTAAIPLTTNPAFFKDIPFDVLRDLAPVTMVTTQPYVVVLNPSVPARTLLQLLALAKAQPGKLTFASHSAGGATHLAGEWLKLLAGVDILHVPYKGQAPALADLLAGHVSMMFDNVSTAIQYGPTGKVRPLASTGPRRSPLLFNGTLPTISEVKGLESFQMMTWLGYMAPAGTPDAVIEAISAEINAVVALPDVTRRLNEMGFDVAASSPQAFAEHVRAELANWSRIVKDAGLKAD
ncbi:MULTISPECIES: Bug family tripartite tricarboxylate transporter substrate binding protein [Ramlibacter]|uniref:Tripartite tricarboxylate transporter substrate binding protein n=1 Tax=Ramlibacter pinisoli TaxID=2682844 RepID=A0A6N8IT05_9BURK|nr:MULTISPECIES: tripartite tricarboxylate transporter substrate binding protein [Ramlibacter]MBA2965029.1 tripartite tricarboxylate transporter substrate binding protein [Ramlibacter sp. CGMCC 1.13660]MVQ29994.1 tripartite tricarboxylate transporter substrate binding protein [Ramlibacter pinisoli]